MLKYLYNYKIHILWLMQKCLAKENMCMHGDALTQLGYHSHDYDKNIKCGGHYEDLVGTVSSPIIPKVIGSNLISI